MQNPTVDVHTYMVFLKLDDVPKLTWRDFLPNRSMGYFNDNPTNIGMM